MATFPVVEAIRIVAQSAPTVLYGDEALIDLASRRAAHLQQLLGPYSREGFHHPGPAVFYLLAPFTEALGHGPGIYLGAIVISGGSLVAAVAVVWHRHGPLAALWSAAVVDLYCLCVLVGTLREPWNPYLVLAPMILFAVLWAEAMVGSTAAMPWAAVVGSYELQTQVSTAAFVLPALAVLGAGWAWRRRRSGRSGAVGIGGAAGATVLGLIWVAPVVELWHDHPNNLGALWDFFAAGHPRTPLGHALSVTGQTLTIVPFGNRDYTLSLDRSGPELAAGLTLLAGAFAAAAILGHRRRRSAALALTGVAALAVIGGSASLAAAPAPLYLYSAEWLSFVPVSLLLAIGLALLSRASIRPRLRHPGRHPRPSAAAAGVAALALAAVAAGALTVRSDLRMGPVATTTVTAGPWPTGVAATAASRSRALQETRILVADVEQRLGPADRTVEITVGSSDLWPYAAGVVDALEQRGTRCTLQPACFARDAGAPASAGRPAVSFELFHSADLTPSAAGRSTVATVDGDVLTMTRDGSNPIGPART